MNVMIAKNFKFLYQHYKDKQEVLAQMFHVPQSNISAYINGKKPIPTDVLNSISVRYGISIDDLINKDLSVEFDSPQTIDLNYAMSLSENMFPILTSNVAKTNDNFNLAYKILYSSLQLDNIEDLHSKIAVLENAISLFQKAWEESNTYVALSNSISIILLAYSFYNQQGIKIAQKLLNKGKLTSFDIRSDFLRNPDKPIEQNPYEQHQKSFFEKYHDLVYDNIKLLKNNINFSALGDFYLAMCYLVDFAEDFIEYKTGYISGIYMLIQLCKLENTYAEKLLGDLFQIS